MSVHYEMVFTCFLKDNTPESVLTPSAGTWTSRAAVGTDECPYPLLTPNADSNTHLAGGELARLVHQSRGSRNAWGLFVRGGTRNGP